LIIENGVEIGKKIPLSFKFIFFEFRQEKQTTEEKRHKVNQMNFKWQQYQKQ